jgi:hypothetical protein
MTEHGDVHGQSNNEDTSYDRNSLRKVRRDSAATGSISISSPLLSSPFALARRRAGTGMTLYVSGLLYLYVAFAAVSEMRERRRLGTPTPRTITAVLSINAGMMLVLGPVVLVEGYFFSGNIPALESAMLRPWLLGCGAASSTLVVHIWDNIVRSGQTSSEPRRCLTRLPWRVALAIVLVMLDIASCVFLLFVVLKTNNQVLIVYVCPWSSSASRSPTCSPSSGSFWHCSRQSMASCA